MEVVGDDGRTVVHESFFTFSCFDLRAAACSRR
jgi:hypothetical protein